MSNVIRLRTKRGRDHLGPEDYSPDARGGNAAIAAVDRIRAGEDPDVVWVSQLDDVFAELDKDLDQGKMFLNAYILGLLEDLKA